MDDSNLGLYKYRLFNSPIEELTDTLEAASVDWIITDPPYPAKYLPTFSALASLAAHVLKPNGGLLVMSGQTFLPEVLDRLSEHLVYRWTCALLTPGGQSAFIFPRRVNPYWKPVLVYHRKDASFDRAFGDVIKTKVNNNDKGHHHWGQNVEGFDDLVRRFTADGDVILDPFLGGGTTAIAALLNKRQFIGSDCDQGCIDHSERRIQAFIKDREKLRCQFGIT